MDLEQTVTGLGNIGSKIPSNWSKTKKDIWAGIKGWRIWLLISWQDIRQRYRRSQLGPFWITISMAVQIYSIGFLYGKLFGEDLSTYYPHLAGGMLSWSFISALILESTSGFIAAENYFRQMKISYSIFIFRVISRNLIVFFHNIFVIVPIIIIFHVPVNWHTLLFILGIIIILFTGMGFGLLLAVIGARFRDICTIFQSVIQICFFLSPIVWQESRLPEKYRFAVDYNPFAQFLNLLREPLLGNVPSLYSYTFTLLFGLISLVLALFIFNRSRKLIIYWL